ncbi:hypothetical protein C6382_17575 [Pseudomonas sp. BBP2017]|nr:hypothetical protein C6382_17575 [Pseudomonas sp. BBP2017]
MSQYADLMLKPGILTDLTATFPKGLLRGYHVQAKMAALHSADTIQINRVEKNHSSLDYWPTAIRKTTPDL